MAGQCTEPGLTITPEGKLSLVGPRAGAWPGTGACTPAAQNGLRVDTATGNLWVRRARAIRSTQRRPPVTFTPANATTQVLTTYDLSITNPTCGPSMALVSFTGGFLGQTMASGNWWSVNRWIASDVNGTPVGFSGIQPIGYLLHNAGGVAGVGGAIEPMTFTAPMPSGAVLRVKARYEHVRPTFVANAFNEVQWRPPDLEIALFTLDA